MVPPAVCTVVDGWTWVFFFFVVVLDLNFHWHVCYGLFTILFKPRPLSLSPVQVCAFCQRLGATMRCHETDCGRSYHFPCAAAAGALQDWSQRRTLCTRHAHTGTGVFSHTLQGCYEVQHMDWVLFLVIADSSRCVLCSDSARPGDLLMCSCCGNCYHGSCLDPPLSPSPLCRAGWQCPECRVCRSCR